MSDSKYAIIQLAGKQYQVQEGDQFIVDRLDQKEAKTWQTSDVLLVAEPKKTAKIGTPLVKGAKVTLKVLQHQRSPKLRVAKYRAKSRYRRVKGHRQHQSLVSVVKIKA
ncbi:MAG: 50S ribosomal protein L21 [Candidatus Pacebacteria bacterium]|nr:50S ribosomal protein L21 [Candidatus Paceibacterota bacterium]